MFGDVFFFLSQLLVTSDDCAVKKFNVPNLHRAASYSYLNGA